MQRCRALTPDCSSVSRPVWPLIGQYWSRDLNTGLWLVIGWDVCRHIIAVSQPEDTHLFRPCSKQQYDPCYIWTITNLSKVRHLICPARHTCIIFQWAWISVVGSCFLVFTQIENMSHEIINTIFLSWKVFCWPQLCLLTPEPAVVHLSDTKVICLIVPHLSHIYCEQIECSKGKLQPKVSPPNLFSRVRYNSYLYNSRAVHWTEVAFCLFPW